MLSAEEIDTNAATFQEQAMRILDDDPRRLEVRFNREWLDMPTTDLLGLVRTTTAAQLLEREDFAKRWEAKEPISLLELLYPLLQGYDSVAVDADVELGGTDQKFNLLLGRDIQRHYARPQQAVMTMPILVGTDGTRKMSKSLGNQIGVADPPGEMFGKTMAIPDEAMEEYYRLLLAPRLGDSAVSDPSGLEGTAARDAKRRLARELVSWLHGEDAAIEAEREWDRVFGEKELPEEIETAELPAEGTVHVPALIAEEFGISRSEARRLLEQGGVWLGERQLGAEDQDLDVAAADGEVLRVGRRRFRRLRRA
jgi:tyrosyl-tRNA synthetase